LNLSDSCRAALPVWRGKKSGRKSIAVSCWAILAVSYWVSSVLPGGIIPFYGSKFFRSSEKILEFKDYFYGIEHYNEESSASERLETQNNALNKSSAIRRWINHSGKIFQKYTLMACAIIPPVMQSYVGLRASRIIVNTKIYFILRPDYVLFSLSSIDRRSPFSTNKDQTAILAHYA